MLSLHHEKRQLLWDEISQIVIFSLLAVFMWKTVYPSSVACYVGCYGQVMCALSGKTFGGKGGERK